MSSDTLLLSVRRASPGTLGCMSSTVRFTATITPDEEWYVARCIEVEVTSQGRTIDEALANLKEALELYFEDEPAPEIHPEPIVAPIEIKLSA